MPDRIRKEVLNAISLFLVVLCIVSVSGCFNSGVREAASEDEMSVNELRESAENGDSGAQHALGMCYFAGLGIEKDLSEAAVWFSKSAEAGNCDGQYCMGLMNMSGKLFGRNNDVVEAFKWFELAAEGGSEEAKEALQKYGKAVRNDHRPEIDSRVRAWKEQHPK